MAEDFQRNRQYAYKENSNLVLSSDRSGASSSDVGKDVPKSLAGRMDYRMGDRISRKDNRELNERIEKAKLKRAAEADNTELGALLGGKKSSKKAKRRGDVLSATADLDSFNYRPSTRESRVAYEELMQFIKACIGDQPGDILRGAADEVLSILKDDKLTAHHQQIEVGKILSAVQDVSFNKLVNIGKGIHDFRSENAVADEGANGAAELDEEQGVAVVFEDDDDGGGDEQEGEYMDAENVGGDESSSDDDDNGDDGDNNNQKGKGHGQVGRNSKEDDDADDGDDDADGLRTRDVDAHWLQRQLSPYYPDANESASMAEQVLNALAEADSRSCENALVDLLDFDKFDLVKLLLQHRAKVYYVSRYRQAQTQEAREAIEQAMAADDASNGPALLAELHAKSSAQNWAADRSAAFASQARREARALRADANGNANGSGHASDDALAPPPSHESSAQGQRVAGKSLDLDGLQFSQGGRVMTNTKCELPDKSWRAQKVGYEEVHVPAVRPIIPPGERLVEVASLPVWAQPAFPGIPTLNRIQSKMLPAAMNGTENMLLCAPTGAGKTNVALMTILNQLGQHRKDDGSFDLDAFKVVYIAPMKALVQECVLSFGKKLAPFGVKVAEMSGDVSLSRSQIEDTQMIVTTPEKWDVITRKAGDRAYTQLVRLVIIDEIHLLHDERGPVLETLVARTLRQVETTREMVTHVRAT